MVMLIGHVREQDGFQVQAQHRPVHLGAVRRVGELNARLRRFRFPVQVRERDANDMLLVREKIDVDGKELVVDRPEENVEETAGEREILLR